MSHMSHYALLGYQSAKENQPKENNPYDENTSSHRDWNLGWCQGKNESVPNVGDQGYYSIGSDTYPVTVVKVSKSGKKIWCRNENFVADEGHDYFGTQKWKITENPNGAVHEYWYSEKRKRYQQGGSGFVGFTGWFARQDPSF